MKHLCLSLILLLSLRLSAQTGELVGTIVIAEGPAAFAQVHLPEAGQAVVTDKDGGYHFTGLAAGIYHLEVTYPGYRSIHTEVQIQAGQTTRRELRLEEDYLKLGDVVITGSRHAVPQYESPVLVGRISNRTFEATQALSVAEGLNFSPGLRVENNCQNCGFTQVRMNGLEGAYSQILINSRPVFSALAGVYGLEMIPPNMIDRIEVVKGGGSALYGGNAIAGTVNIITKDPIENSFEIGLNQGLTGLEASDRTLSFNGAIVSDDLSQGVSLYGFHRDRAPWDANDDGFSEVTLLRNTTFGFDAFWNLSKRGKLKLNGYVMDEFRRGGNKFDLAPHQTDVTEQLDHQIVGSGLSYEHVSRDYKHKISAYVSAQFVRRGSYYGGGGRVLGPQDSLTASDLLAINAYGQSRDVSLVGGLQYAYGLSEKAVFLAGSEYQYNDVIDEMPGYERIIDQRVGTLGTYAQLEWDPTERVSLLAGGRFDLIDIAGLYDLGEERFDNQRTLPVLVPRATLMYELLPQLKLRASFAQGYRAPQAFDEDLHIETVGGAARFIRLDPGLQTERSHSATLSLNYTLEQGRFQLNAVAEGFYTHLLNPFLLSDQAELPSGVAIIQKRNGEGARVQGVNLELNLAYGSTWLLQGGATLQTATYDVEEELWAPEDPRSGIPATTTQRLLRTPQAYGFFTLTYAPDKRWLVAYSGVFTGHMAVPHVIDPETERTIIQTTPSFFESNLKVSRTILTARNHHVTLFAGIQNMFNSFQEDFDIGPARDAGYVYGPSRPRTAFAGIKFGLN
ncbi:MAG: TonB-dependent receptor [Bacteroidetes bacterium]|nr:MAG: TonB-dependent receptor [Bacteroidota bacterium]